MFDIAFSFLKSIQNLLVPSFFLTNTIGALNSEFDGSKTPSQSYFQLLFERLSVLNKEWVWFNSDFD